MRRWSALTLVTALGVLTGARVEAEPLVGRWEQFRWEDRDGAGGRSDGVMEFTADGKVFRIEGAERQLLGRYTLGPGIPVTVRTLSIKSPTDPNRRLTGLVQLFGDVAKLELFDPAQPLPSNFSDVLRGTVSDSLVVLRRVSPIGNVSRGDLTLAPVREELLGVWYVLPWSSTREKSSTTMEFTAEGRVLVKGSSLWGEGATWEGTYQLNPSVVPIWLDLRTPHGSKRGLLQQIGSSARLEIFTSSDGPHPTQFSPEPPPLGPGRDLTTVQLIRVPPAERLPGAPIRVPAAPASATATGGTNDALVRSFFSRRNAGDFDGVVAMLGDDVVQKGPSLSGPAAIIAREKSLYRKGDWMEVVETKVEGEEVVRVRVVFHAVSVHRTLDYGWYRFVVREGKIRRIETPF